MKIDQIIKIKEYLIKQATNGHPIVVPPPSWASTSRLPAGLALAGLGAAGLYGLSQRPEAMGSGGMGGQVGDAVSNVAEAVKHQAQQAFHGATHTPDPPPGMIEEYGPTALAGAGGLAGLAGIKALLSKRLEASRALQANARLKNMAKLGLLGVGGVMGAKYLMGRNNEDKENH